MARGYKIVLNGAIWKMEYIDTGVTKFAIGKPTGEERKKLKEDGYTFMANGRNEYEPYEEYEIWLK